MCWVAGQIGVCYSLPLLQCLIFGSLISATDPVTVLAIFQELGVNIDLYSLVFGESVLNDAVAIVLYKTLLTFLTAEVTFESILTAFGFFALIFVGSLAIGTMFALAVSLLFKYLGPIVTEVRPPPPRPAGAEAVVGVAVCFHRIARARSLREGGERCRILVFPRLIVFFGGE